MSALTANKISYTREHGIRGAGSRATEGVRVIDVNALLLSSSWKRAFCFLLFALLGIACPIARNSARGNARLSRKWKIGLSVRY